MREQIAIILFGVISVVPGSGWYNTPPIPVLEASQAMKNSRLRWNLCPLCLRSFGKSRRKPWCTRLTSTFRKICAWAISPPKASPSLKRSNSVGPSSAAGHSPSARVWLYLSSPRAATASFKSWARGKLAILETQTRSRGSV